jgi:hypothetical protein
MDSHVSLLTYLSPKNQEFWEEWMYLLIHLHFFVTHERNVFSFSVTMYQK